MINKIKSLFSKKKVLCWDEEQQALVYDHHSYRMLPVAGGAFLMGATREQGNEMQPWEQPTHEVRLSSFALGETPVPQWLWQAVMGENPSYSKGEMLPMESVSWNDVQAFLKRLNTLTGQRFSLPTEAQWEYAARGGAESKHYKYSGGFHVEEVAWFADNSDGHTHEVAQLKPNELGLYDMNGNVWELCHDFSASYLPKVQTDPTGPMTGENRIGRGGGWGSPSRSCRVSSRSYGDPDALSNRIGFRLAKR